MTFTTIFIIAGVVLLAIFILIAKLALRWAMRLAIVGVIILAIAGGGVFWWWSNRLVARPQQDKPRPTSTKRAASR
jgi:protein-S-isoprenylcysteine O-methyltransferase Ste14